MKLYSFNDLTEAQRKALYNFIISFGSNHYFDSYDEMVKDYTGPVFNNGTTYYSLWNGEVIKGTIGVITKDVQDKGEVFITSINILEQDKTAFKDLLVKAIEDALKVNPQIIKLGIYSNREYLIPFVEEFGFKGVYKAVILQLKSSEDILKIEMNENVAFTELTQSNRLHFKEVHNEGFLHSPNGSMITDEQLDEMLQNNVENKNLAGICYLNNEPIGIYELIIKDQVGWIESIAVAPKWHDKGLGKIILKKSIDTLYELGVENIKLYVISSNQRAYKLYLKYGFEEEKVTSSWFEKKVL